MATGFDKTLERGHDVIYTYCCTTCARKNLNAEALFYCKDCRKQFCEGCEQYHDKFTEGHRVFGRNDVAKWGDVKPVTSSLMCDEHPGKELEMYCKDHDRVYCSICIHIKHRACKQVTPVSDVAMGKQNTSKLKRLLSEAAKIQSTLNMMYDQRENNIKQLQQTRKEIVSALKNMKTKINQIIDRLEETSISEMDRILSILKEKIASEKDTCLHIHDKIQKVLHDFKNFEIQCNEMVFQGYKICAEQITSAEMLLTSLQDVDYQLKFTPSVKTEQYLSSLKTFGNFALTPSSLDDTLKSYKLATPLTQPDHVYTIVNSKTYSVKTCEDTANCWITGVCQLSDGQIAVVDCRNQKVKLLSASTYLYLDELVLPDSPKNICHTTGTELAVTVCDYQSRHEVQFIDVRHEKLSHLRTVKLDHGCRAIAYHTGKLYVGSDDALYVYSLSGKKILKLYEDESSYISKVFRLSLGDDGRRIYVANYDNMLLLTLDSSGKQLSTFSDPELQFPAGVCVADNGTLFVCGESSHSILQLDREGHKKISTLITIEENEEVCIPQSLCYDRKTQTLLVGRDETDDLLALQLK